MENTTKLSELLATGFICGLIAAVVIIAMVFALDRLGYPTSHDPFIAVLAGAITLISIFIGVRKVLAPHN